MSNNHPNDNIYSILGKLDALKPTQEEKHQSLLKEIRESIEAKGSITEGVSSIETKLQQQFNEGVAEVAPPGAKAERMVKGIKKSLSKDGHLSDKDKAIAYATTWKAHNKGQVEEAGTVCAECGMNEGECEHTMDEAYNPNSVDAQHRGETKAHSRAELKKKADAGDKDAQAKLARYKEKDANKSQAFNDRMEYNEAEITRTDGKTTHRKTEFPGYPADDADDLDNLRGPGAGKRGRPRKHAVVAPKVSATGEKLGRGRPVKAKAPTFSKQADPFGRVSGTVPKGKKGTVHSMSEAMTQLELSLNTMQLTEGRLMDDTGETIGHILNRFRAEVRNFEQGGDLDESLYDALYDYYVECGEMPYGVQKARTGDPMRWVAEHLQAELSGSPMGGQQEEDPLLTREAGIPGNVPTEQIPGKEDLLKGKGRSYYEEEVTMEDELSELARLAGLQTEGNAFSGKLAHTAKGSSFEQDGKTFTNRSSIADEAIEEEGSPQADQDYDKDGEVESEKDEVIGSRRKAAGLDESLDMGGDSSDFNINTSMSSNGDKNVTVTATGDHAASLLQMLRIAGLGGGDAAQALQPQAEPEMGMDEPEIVIVGEPDGAEIEEEGIEVDQPAVAPQNPPNEKYGTIKNITTQGDDLNRQKKQDPQTANKAANPMTNAQQTLRAVEQLESKLAEEYESIKKVSK